MTCTLTVRVRVHGIVQCTLRLLAVRLSVLHSVILWLLGQRVRVLPPWLEARYVPQVSTGRAALSAALPKQPQATWHAHRARGRAKRTIHPVTL